MSPLGTDGVLTLSPQGLYCPAGRFHIDPWLPVRLAIVTHAHSDHARAGCDAYLCSDRGRGVLAERVHRGAVIETLPYGKAITIGGARVSLHPAGHILGSAQVCVEVRGERWVVTGDYKTAPDQTCDPFEPVTCHTLITESTFGLPVFRWDQESAIHEEMLAWWEDNRRAGLTSVLLTYALGKAQRVLAAMRDLAPGPIGVHGAVARFLPLYEAAGVPMPRTVRPGPETVRDLKGQGLIIAPPSVHGTTYLRRFQPCSIAMASGWMSIRGIRRRRALDRGFVLSDHADWPGLLDAIRQSGAHQVGVTHGYTDALAGYLDRTQGLKSFVVPTRFRGESLTGEEEEVADESAEGLNVVRDLAGGAES